MQTNGLLGLLFVVALAGSAWFAGSSDYLGRLGTALLGIVAAATAALLVLSFAFSAILEPKWNDRTRAVQGEALIDTLPPGIVMERLLHRLYGNHEANGYIARGVLGGLGDAADASDLSISTSARIEYELKTETPGTYELTYTQHLSFDSPVTDHTLVLFATCDAELRDILVAGCAKPLLDWVYVADQEIFFHDQGMLSSVDIGVRYRDHLGVPHSVEMSTIQPRYVDSRDWPDYLQFFSRSVGSIEYRDPGRHFRTLRIFEVDLTRLALPDAAMVEVTGLSIRSRTPQPDQGAAFWQANFPTLVDQLTFDVTALRDDRDRTLEFTLVSFLPSAGFVVSNEWVRAEDLGTLDVGSWALPGHGVALLWRVAVDQDGVEV